MSELITTVGLSKIYHLGSNKVAALESVSISVAEREFVAVQGTSGSGKSTLLNILGGLDTPSAGEVIFEGQSLRPFTKREMAYYRRRCVGMIFQNYNLISAMTAQENVELALAFGGVPRSKRKELTCQLLGRVGLDDRLRHCPSELSGGEQQRVAVARALANKPRVLLADEPTGNLDSTRARELLALLRGMVDRDNLTIIMVTHDQQLAQQFADRTIFMKDGAVVEKI